MSDPYVHLTHLRGHIVEPTTSFYRSLDLGKIDAQVAQAGGPPDWRRTDEARETSRVETLGRRTEADLWVFAYGSLMWDPGFLFSEVRLATLDGYRRSFCLRTDLGRGTPERPGLMAGLDVGGACQGMAFRIAREQVEEETRVIWRREMLLPAYAPAFVSVETPQGSIEAIAFIVDRAAPSYVPDLSEEERAQWIGTAEGFLGTSLEYLENLAERFELLGVRDDELFALRARARALRPS